IVEIIQEHKDQLPELEQLEHIGLFSHAEIKAIIKKASDLEALFKDDFTNYVQYEINLLEQIQRRTCIGYSFRNDEIENSVVHGVQGVFRCASAKRKDDIQLWLSYVVFFFCKKWATKTQLSKVFSAMLAIHSNKPAFTRQLFLWALYFHPEGPKLYQDYFRMRLMHAEKLRKEKQEFEKANMDVENPDYSEEILKGELARIIYENSVSAEFHVSLLSTARRFDFAKGLQKEIYDDPQALHTDDLLTWDYAIEPQTGEEQPTTKCCAAYEEAVKTLPTEAMWKCYITFCLERFTKKTNSGFLRGKRLERTMTAFRKLLPEFQYKQEALEVAVAGTELFRDSGTKWQMNVHVVIDSKSPDIAMLFEEDSVHLEPQVCLPFEDAKSQEDTEAIFKKVLLAVTGANSVTLKGKYLDWAYQHGGYKKVRAVYTSLQDSHPFSVDFFRKMIQFEKEQQSCKMVNIREYYERALREFGSMDYIKEPLNHPLGRPENCGQIYWRAMKMLQGESAEASVAKHAMETGCL
uniref:U3 small nucleolar RNA-associated protein 6 homolog n=1 Tax=Mandrillus leucophaeus TaxID=9568 RepID=A0A2K5ZRG5_MANLE